MKIILLACVFLVDSVNFSIACECGLEGSVSRIHKGFKVRPHKYPWIAHIRSFHDRNSRSYGQCGGSLIDETHVVTAAHCVYNSNNRLITAANIEVYLGKVNAFTEHSRHFPVSNVWTSPNYNRKDLFEDLAILTLANAVGYNRTISPVCLPNSDQGLSELIVSGWGITSHDVKVASDTLLEVDVSYVTEDECNDLKTKYLLKKNGIPISMAGQVNIPKVAKTHICAINKKTMGDACSGDSGGPLMKKGDNGLYYLMGVVSGSWTECGESTDTAGLYTRITFYRDTIKKIAPNACWKN